MTARTWVGRVCLHQGRVTEDGPWLGSLVRQRPDDDDDELYVLVEPASPNSVEYTSQLVDVIGRLYTRDPLSLTGALTRALRAAHDHLLDWNRNSLKEHRVGAGASCLALRGTEAYLAQVGPSVAYVLRGDGSFRRMQSADVAFDESLGIADQFAPTLTRLALEPGDLVLLASSKLDGIVPDDHVRAVMSRGIDDALPEFYRLCRDENDVALLVLACFDEPDLVDEPPEYLTRDGANGAASSTPDVQASQDAVGELVLVGAPAGDAPEMASASLASTFDGGFDLPRRPSHEEVQEIAQSTAPPSTTGLRLKGEAGPPRFKRATGLGPVPRVRVPKLAIFAAAAVAVLVAVVWWQFPGSVEDSREDRFVTLVAGAREANARAQATGDPGLRRQLLTDAQMKLDDAAKIHKENGEVVSLRADVDDAIGVLNAEYLVRDFTEVVDLKQVVGGSLSVTHTVTGGGNAYLLDAEGRRVLRVPLAGGVAPETIVQEGELAGAVTVARPAHIIWSDQTQSLIVIDEQRQAFGYFPSGGALPLTVRGADAWSSVDAISASGGNLYVLDVDGNQVWRYLPGQGGFDSERTALLDGADLTNATEIAVGAGLYVLDSELGVRRFDGGVEAPFPLAGIDRPLASPAALQVLPGSNRLVVADRANKRIVVTSSEGAFLGQIVSPAFTDLRAVSIDEGASTMYILNGDTLIKAQFPL